VVNNNAEGPPRSTQGIRTRNRIKYEINRVKEKHENKKYEKIKKVFKGVPRTSPFYALQLRVI
jgi:hypothetical protein